MINQSYLVQRLINKIGYWNADYLCNGEKHDEFIGSLDNSGWKGSGSLCSYLHLMGGLAMGSDQGTQGFIQEFFSSGGQGSIARALCGARLTERRMNELKMVKWAMPFVEQAHKPPILGLNQRHPTFTILPASANISETHWQSVLSLPAADPNRR